VELGLLLSLGATVKLGMALGSKLLLGKTLGAKLGSPLRLGTPVGAKLGELLLLGASDTSEEG